MPRYQYIAIAGSGKKVKGTITAESPFAARKQLRMRSVHPSSITEVSSGVEEQTRAVSRSFRGTSKTQLIDFTKQLATLLNSGIKLTEALSVLTLQTLGSAVQDRPDRDPRPRRHRRIVHRRPEGLRRLLRRDLRGHGPRRRGHRHPGREPQDHRRLHGEAPAGGVEGADGDDLPDASWSSSACWPS